ncbi:MAG: hypothetical protein U5L10_02110 [Candidatus Moranbacteria bacterium]|nr:hypothetical protein [Candidatus Moranbacteria bacterium]
MQFEEPEDQYDFDEVKQKDVKTKIRVAVLFVVFLFLIFSIVQNDFNFSFVSGKDYGFVCSPGNKLKRGDDDELETVKAKRVIESNLSKIEQIKGFEDAAVDYKKSYNGGKRPVVKIILNETAAKEKNLPEEICSFELKYEYE